MKPFLVAIVILIVASAPFALYYWWYSRQTPERRADIRQRASQRREYEQNKQRSKALRRGKLVEHRRISVAGKKLEGGGLACPHCGGTNFKAKRSKGAKALLIPTVGAAALLARKTRVKCETCGTEYLRG